MWEVHDGTVDPFEGGYAAYVLQRVERQRQSNRRRDEAPQHPAQGARLAAPRSARRARRSRSSASTRRRQLIEDEPPPRDNVELAKLADRAARQGRRRPARRAASTTAPGPVLEDVEWRIAPGERTGILGPNGVGKSTLLGLVSGTVEPTSGRVKRGKTVQVAVLSQRLTELDQYADERVRDVLALQKTSYVTGGKELTPTQLLERLGFRSSELSTPVRDLSGGQKRRLQLLLVLLGEPNVLILDEPSNDLDTDMLAALEDLLDSWPGTLLVVSHDRYLIERVTDQQYAIENGGLRHLPGGVDEYLRGARPRERLRSSSRPRRRRLWPTG